jgi:copper transport protein
MPLVVGLLVATPPVARAHAVLLGSTPADRGRVGAAPARVTLRFSEPVELLRSSDVLVVDEQRRPVLAGPARRSPDDARVVAVALRPKLPPASYTVRYRVISADAHIIDGDTTFATGGAALKPAALGLQGGPGETSAWSVGARFLELVGLGGALALIAFRWLVWRPATAPTDATAPLAWFRDRFWTGLWTLIGVALAGEAAVLTTKTATSLGKGVPAAIADPSGVYRFFSETRFGDHFQVRLAILLVAVAVASWEYLAEGIAEEERREPPPRGGRAAPMLIIGGLLATCLALISSQGHASQAPLSSLSVPVDTVHLMAVSVWVGGLGILGLVLAALPRVARQGTALGAALLARFSSLALGLVAVAVLTGTLRAVGELADPAQLWNTAYGRTIVAKVALLCPLAVLALQNRRIVAAVATAGRANRATLRLVARNARIELGLSLAIVLAASLLVAEVPGRV